MNGYDVALGVLSLLGGAGGLAAFFQTVRYFRGQASVDRRIETESETSLAATLANLNETLTRGVFETNAAHALAMASVHEQHARDMAAERAHCDERLSAMGRRVDEVQKLRAHDLKNYLGAVLALAQLAKLPADKTAELARALELSGLEGAD